MGRAGRYWVGFIGSGVIALAGLICLLVAAVQSGDGFRGIDQSFATARAEATVTSALDDGGYLDVAFRTEDGERVVSYLWWPYDTEPPAVGKTIRVAYDPEDPEYEVFAADEVDGLLPPDPDDDDSQAGATALVGGALLVSALPLCLLTVLWARRAPQAPDRSPYLTGYGPHPGFPVPPPYWGQPYPGQPYQGQPYPGQPYPVQYAPQPYQVPYAPQPYQGYPPAGQPYPDQYPPQPPAGQTPSPVSPQPQPGPLEPESPVSGFVVPPS